MQDFPGSMHRIVGGDYCIIPYLGPSGDLPPGATSPVALRGVQEGYCLLGGQDLPPGTPGTLLGPRTWCMISRGACTKSYPVFPIKSTSPVFVTFQVFPGEAISGQQLSGPVPSRERGPNAPRIPAPRPWTRMEEVRGLLSWQER